MALDPLKVAIWRFEHIAPLLDPCLSDSQRSELVNQMASTPVRWLSGRDSPIARSTLYQWLSAYRAKPEIESLLPNKRGPCLRQLCIKPEWIDHALALIEEEPVRSLYILTQRIQTKFQLPAPPSRSSLQRALSKQRRYVAVRTAQHGPRRTHFVAAKIHQMWQGDAKADFIVTFTDGTSHKVRIVSLIDDCSRFILAALVVASESLVAVCRTFYSAAARYGLPDSFYADRGSPYDAYVFRQGLAVLGVRRINTRARNPSAHGKIESYHRSLGRWFIKELPHQPVTDFVHLQLLLDAFIDKLYNQHIHRELKKSPYAAFNNTISARTVSLQRLHQAFLKTSSQMPHPKTGAVRVNGVMFRIPSHYLVPRKNLSIAEDLLDSSQVFLANARGLLIALQPAVRIMQPKETTSSTSDVNFPVGSLSAMLETYRGRSLPRPVGGFGLPEIYRRLAIAVDRAVPDTEREAGLVLQWLKEHGPFQPEAFNAAIEAAIIRLGKGRTLSQLLDELTRIIKRSKLNKEINHDQ
jgi:transposase InsO family protein